MGIEEIKQDLSNVLISDGILDLGGYKIDDDGASLIAAFMSSNKALKKNYLANNVITDKEGAKEIIEVAKKTTLEKIDLSNQIANDVVESLLQIGFSNYLTSLCLQQAPIKLHTIKNLEQEKIILNPKLKKLLNLKRIIL